MSGQGQTDPHWSTHHVPVQPEEHADIYFRLEFPFAQVLIFKIVGLIFLFMQARLVDKMFLWLVSLLPSYSLPSFSSPPLPLPPPKYLF